MDLTPPHDLDAEKSLLGAMMLDSGAALGAISLVSPGMFFRESHGEIFSAISDLVTTGNPSDVVSVADKLSSSGLLERVGGKSYLLDIVNSVYLAGHYRRYAEIVKKKAALRAVIRGADEIKMVANEDPDELEETLSRMMYGLASTLHTGNEREQDIVTLVAERLSHCSEPEHFFSVPGFDGLHLFGGDLFVVGGRPGAGKTAFATRLLLKWSEEAPVRMYSYEMTERQLADRVISALTGISVEDIEAGVEEDIIDLAMRLTDESFNNKQFSVRVAAGMTNAELFADMYKFASQGGKIVCVDYMQLAADKTRAGLTPDVTLFSNKLRRVALDTGLLVVGIAQLNRQVEERDKVHLPIMSDIRESGTIEQDATQICMLTSVPNPKVSQAGRNFVDSAITDRMRFSGDMLDAGSGNPDDDPVLVVVDFIKVRQGKRRRWPFIFEGSCMRFTPLQKSAIVPTRKIPVDSQEAMEFKNDEKV